MIKCPFHVKQRLFLKLLTPSLPLLPWLQVNRSKKEAQLYILVLKHSVIGHI